MIVLTDLHLSECKANGNKLYFTCGKLIITCHNRKLKGSCTSEMNIALIKILKCVYAHKSKY
jgi:hypothetical protein